MGAHRAASPLADRRARGIPSRRRVRGGGRVVGERAARRRRPASLLTRRPRAVVHAALAAALLLVGCQREPEPTGRPLVLTSFYPIYEFTREITGSSARVVS